MEKKEEGRVKGEEGEGERGGKGGLKGRVKWEAGAL